MGTNREEYLNNKRSRKMKTYDEIDKIRAKNLLEEIKEFAEEEEISLMEAIEIYKLLEIKDIKEMQE